MKKKNIRKIVLLTLLLAGIGIISSCTQIDINIETDRYKNTSESIEDGCLNKNCE